MRIIVISSPGFIYADSAEDGSPKVEHSRGSERDVALAFMHAKDQSVYEGPPERYCWLDYMPPDGAFAVYRADRDGVDLVPVATGFRSSYALVDEVAEKCELIGFLTTDDSPFFSTSPRKPTMTSAELRSMLDRIGLSQTGASRILGVSDRQVRRWIAGEIAVPSPVAKLLRLIEAGTLTTDVVRDA